MSLKESQKAINKADFAINEENYTQSNNEQDIYADFAGFASLQTPLLPDSIYESLPDLLKKSCRYTDNARSRDVMLLSALTILSCCTRGIHGIYDKKTTYPNLYTFIIAPAASGKGIMNEAKSLGDYLHHEIAYNKDGRFVESSSKTPLLFIPASCSKVALINHLKDSNNCGIICETEADTLYNALKQKWGDFSDLLRKGFHNEEISHSSGNDGYSSIKKPRLSVLLTSTPSQVPGIIESPEDGLFSRFIYYNYFQEPKWKDVFAEDDIDYSTYYEKLSDEVLELARYSIENPCKFSLSENQKHIFNYTFKKKLSESKGLGNAGESSITLRAGGICFRIAMLLTELTRFESKTTHDITECSDVNFKTALEISKVLEEHSKKTLNDISRTTETSTIYEFLKALPQKFKTPEIVKKYKGIIPPRTIYDRIEKLLKDGKLKRSSTLTGIIQKA